MQSYKIQKMDYQHIDDVLQVAELCYGVHHWSKDSFVAELNNKISSYYCILDENGKCFGYVGIWKIVNEAHITSLSVHPDYQHKKYAHRLLLEAIKECYAQKIKFITLEVRASNQRAISLYEKFGFKSLGLRKKYYQDNNEDALIMWSENIFDKKYKELYDKIEAELDGEKAVGP